MTLRKRLNGLRCTKDFIPEHERGSGSRYAPQINGVRCIQQKRGAWKLTTDQQDKNAMTPPKN